MTLLQQRFTILFIFTILSVSYFAQNNEIYNKKNYSPNYQEIVQFYKNEAKKNNALLLQMGVSDGNVPIYLFLKNVPKDSVQALEFALKNTVILINNAIHAGEPDGVNASMRLLAQFDQLKVSNKIVLAIIPAYNVDGILERSTSSRANQNGPEEYGFRANAQHLDLNRDFIKSDSENAFTFSKIFQSIDPDVFVDTHVSNGANYQYALTYIAAMKERLPTQMCDLLYSKCLPQISRKLKNKSIELFPYVDMIDDTLEHGIGQFNDLPRYAFGYARLFHSLSFTTETHMLKPFDLRVEVTFQFLKELLSFTNSNCIEIEKVRENCKSEIRKLNYYDFKRSTTPDSICFLGFEPAYKKSEITGANRLYYDEKKPFERKIPFFNQFMNPSSIQTPSYFLVSQNEKEIIKRLKANNLKYQIIQNDSNILVQTQRVVSFTSNSKPYEGHFYHRTVKIERENEMVRFQKGDFIITTNQERSNFISSVLLPEMEDSYFRWNFFDNYLQQKEGFSDYVFEDLAKVILNENPSLNLEFQRKKESDPIFVKDADAQLDWIYKHSKYYEKSAFRLPVFEIK